MIYVRTSYGKYNSTMVYIFSNEEAKELVASWNIQLEFHYLGEGDFILLM